MVLLISGNIDIGTISGFVFFSDGEFLCGVVGQIVDRLFRIVCFVLVGVAEPIACSWVNTGCTPGASYTCQPFTMMRIT